MEVLVCVERGEGGVGVDVELKVVMIYWLRRTKEARLQCRRCGMK